MPELRIYQHRLIDALSKKAALGKKRLIAQLATGGGKTVCFAGLIQRFLIKQQKRVVIIVHREELLKQAVRTLFEWYNISAAPVTADTNYLPNVMVYVGMVETVNNRLKKNPAYFGNVGLLIADECHVGNHKKVYDYFKESIIIGFTATPISGSKKDPLKNYFEDICCGIDIPDLIAERSLVQNRTYHIRNIERKNLLIKNGEFDEAQMGSVFSSSKHVHNCLKAYRDYSEGKKTIIFNCNIAHSKKVNDAFLSYGYPSKHLDGETDHKERGEILQWFKKTPNAILNNCSVLTTGFDETSIITGIINRSTMSTSLWLQMAGRMARPHTGKEYFQIIDMGGNALYHGDWCESRDWSDIFFNPEKPKGPGEAPVKACVSCNVLIHLSQRICPHCGALNAQAVKYDEGIVQFELLSSQKPIDINVKQLIAEQACKLKADGQPYKDISVLHTIKYKIIIHAQRIWRLKKIDDKTAYKLIVFYEQRVKDWVDIKGEKYAWCNNIAKEWMMAELKRTFDWEPVKLTA